MRIQDIEITNDRCRPLAHNAFGYYNTERHEAKTELATVSAATILRVAPQVTPQVAHLL